MRSNIKVFHSHREAQEDYEDEVFSLKPEERVSITEHLRRQYFLMKNKPVDLRVKKIIKIEKVGI